MSQTVRRWLVAGVAVVILAVVAGLSLSSSSSDKDSGQVANVTDKEAFDLPAHDGEGRVRLADFKGLPVVVNFFASWCGPCKVELPLFTKAATGLQGKVQFIGVNSQDPRSGAGLELAEEFGLEAAGITLAKDVGGRAGSLLHDDLGRGMPVNAFYDSEGKLMEARTGALTARTMATTLKRLYGIDAVFLGG